jgi:hypothetical protein
MCPVIDNPASCKIHIVIHFLRAKIMSATKIHHELCVVYGQNVMSEGTVRQWCTLFRDWRTNVHDEEQSGQPFVVSDDLIQSVDQKICERRCFTISELSCEFSQTLCTVLYEIITLGLGHHKFRTHCVLKMLMGAHKTQRISWALTFLNFIHIHNIYISPHLHLTGMIQLETRLWME